MRKNVSGQIVGGQLVSKTDGSAVTAGTTTVYVLGDGGTQAAGSVSSGACTHEGNGFWTYAPAQAETNYDHIAFTFVNTSAVNATVQVYPSFPQTGDNFARLGAPAGASVSADVAAVKAVLPSALVSGRIDASVGAMASGVVTATSIAADAITAAKIADGAIDAATFAAGAINAAAIASDAITDAKVASDVTIASVTGSVGSVTGAVGSVTGNVGGNVAGSVGSVTGAVASVTGNVGGNVTGSVGSVATGGISSASFAAGAINAAAIATDAIDADALAADAVTEIQSGLSTLNAAGVRTAVGLASANLDTQLSTIDDFLDTEIAAIKAKTDNLPNDPASASTVASSFSTVNSNISTVAGYVDTEVGAIKTVTDRLNDTLENDGGTYRFTTNALEQAPSGGSAPTADEIADEVQTRTIAAVTVVNGLAANSVTAAAVATDAVTEIAAAIWASVLEGSLTAEDLVLLLAAVAVGKTTIVDGGGGAATVTFRNPSDTKDAVVATMADSERTALTLDP